MALLRGYLYVIADKDRHFAKIGMSRDVFSHFRELVSSCPLELEIVSSHPCTYVRFREFKTHEQLKDLQSRNGWFRWDEVRIRVAVDKALSITDETIKPILGKLRSWEANPPRAGVRDYPVKRTDTGETFPTTKDAAAAVLGSRKLASKIRLAVKNGVKCGPSFWAKAEEGERPI